ncbi:hypothetical protein [[Clostridium] fimetarium]|uniref:hypothetical protein n=1 Tax=[Clostridium] fimetarium TaxID=99656 RepID=UPI000B82BBA1|nr:hypothetical protein [[Clostridium] fimetarium]
MKKLRKFCFVVIVCLILTSCASNNESVDKNILPKMQDGLENSDILIYYKQDIDDVNNVTNSKSIKIWYYDIDLNDDGLVDKIVIIRSSLYSGSQGDTFDILIRKSNGTFMNASPFSVIPLYTQDNIPEKDTSVAILKARSNGFYDIEIRKPGDIKYFKLEFDGARYKIDKD